MNVVMHILKYLKHAPRKGKRADACIYMLTRLEQ